MGAINIINSDNDNYCYHFLPKMQWIFNNLFHKKKIGIVASA